MGLVYKGYLIFLVWMYFLDRCGSKILTIFVLHWYSRSNLVSSSLKLGRGVSFLKFGQRGESWKYCSEIGGSLRKESFQIVSSVFLKKSMFSLLLEYFSLSGKYSHLLKSIYLFFHVVYFLQKNYMLWNLFSSYSYF